MRARRSKTDGVRGPSPRTVGFKISRSQPDVSQGDEAINPALSAAVGADDAGLTLVARDGRNGSLFDRASNLARILVMSETMPLAAVKARFSELVDRVERQQDRVVVTRNGKPAAVLISPDDLGRLEETLAVLSDRSLMRQIRESEKSIAAGASGTALGELHDSFERRRTSRR